MKLCFKHVTPPTSDPPNLSRSWLLPLLKEKVRGAELSYYMEQLLPLAGWMRTTAQSWKEKGRELERSTMETLEEQVSFPHVS